MVLLANIGQEEGRGKYLGKRMLNLISNMLNFWCSRNIMSLGFYGGTAALPLKYPLEIVMVLLDDPSLLWQHMSRNPDTPCPLWLMTHASAFFLPCLKFSGIIVDSTSKTPQRSKYAYEMKLLSRVRLLATQGLQPTRLVRPWDFPGKSTGVECHCLFWMSRWFLIFLASQHCSWTMAIKVFDLGWTLYIVNLSNRVRSPH